MRKREKNFRNVTMTMRDVDIKDLEEYINKQKNLIDIESPINKSLVVRKALRLLYEVDQPFDQIKTKYGDL